MNKILSKLDYIDRLMEINKMKDSAYSSVSRYLYEKIRTNSYIEMATQVANAAGVSNSLITKFLKYIDIDGWSALKYIHNSIVDNATFHKTNEKNGLNDISQMIEKARKIIFIGVSSSLHVNRDFAMKLARLDKWVVVPDNKYEQVGLSNLLVAKDLMIVTSISLQHVWMKKMIKETKAKVLVVTANGKTAKELKPNYIQIINPDKYNISQTRVFTTYARRKIIEYFDEIYESLIDNSHNAYLLRLTAYN